MWLGEQWVDIDNTRRRRPHARSCAAGTAISVRLAEASRACSSRWPSDNGGCVTTKIWCEKSCFVVRGSLRANLREPFLLRADARYAEHHDAVERARIDRTFGSSRLC